MSATPSGRSKHWYWLLLIPCVAVLWVPSYNTVEPTFVGMPFFYWYQLLWVPISALITGVVFWRTEGRSG